MPINTPLTGPYAVPDTVPVFPLAGALLLRGYGPGLITALAINLPFSLILLNTAWDAAWYPHAALLWLVPLALFLHGPVLVGLLVVTSRIRFG